MERIIKLNKERRQTLFETTAKMMKISSVVVEKDFWVCVVLDYLMNISKYKDYFIFKGGTSLSKCYDVIDRFSEDIDLVIKWDKLGFKEDDVLLNRSKSQDYKFETIMNNKGAYFIQNVLKDDLVTNLASSIDEMRIESDPNDPMILLVYYPTTYKNNYIQQAVRLEIGPVSAITPTEYSQIEPYCFKCFNDDNKRPFKVRIITIARTFWEKILILYTECNRPTDKKTPDRYSRHYYDVYMIYTSKYFKEIIRDKNLFEDVRRFKSKYYRNSWSNIENVTLNSIRLIPSEKRLETIKDDYQKMADMFFRTPPSFEDLLVGLRELEEELNNL